MRVRRAKLGVASLWITHARLGFAGVAIAVIAAVPLVHGQYVQYKAARCMDQVLSLRLGQSTFLDAQRIGHQFGGTQQAFDREGCSAESCVIAFQFRNTWLEFYRLSPPTELDVGVSVLHGVVVARHVNYLSAAPGAYASIYITEQEPAPGTPNFRVHVLTTLTGEPKKATVSLTSAATAEERHRAYSFDLRCLGRLGGCKERSRIFGSALPAGG